MPITSTKCPGCGRLRVIPERLLAKGEPIGCKCSCGARYHARGSGGIVVIENFVPAANGGAAPRQIGRAAEGNLKA